MSGSSTGSGSFPVEPLLKALLAQILVQHRAEARPGRGRSPVVMNLVVADVVSAAKRRVHPDAAAGDLAVFDAPVVRGRSVDAASRVGEMSDNSLRIAFVPQVGPTARRTLSLADLSSFALLGSVGIRVPLPSF